MSNSMRSLALTITFILLLSLQCHAQTINHALGGVSQINILIEGLDSASIDCGIPKELIRSAVLYPVSAARLRVVDNGEPTLYVNVSSLFFKPINLCVSNFAIRIESFQHVALDVSGRTIMAPVMLWQKGGIFSTVRPDHSHHVTEVVEVYAKKFVTDWNLDNK